MIIHLHLINHFQFRQGFDRKSGEKIFTITFAALLEADFRSPSCDYEAFFKLVRVLTKDATYDKEQLYKIMCFNVLAHNRDDHTKNFSFLYTDMNGWKLAPAYDLTYSDTYWGEHTTSVNGKGKNISDNDLITLGIGAGLSEKMCSQHLTDIRNEVKALEKYFDNQKAGNNSHVPFSKRLSDITKPNL